MKPATPERCCMKVYPRDRWGAFNAHFCGKTAKVQHEGEWYCGIHSPEAVAARKAKQDALYKAHSDAWAAKHAATEERDRKADAYPQLEAENARLRGALYLIAAGDPDAQETAKAALKGQS